MSLEARLSDISKLPALVVPNCELDSMFCSSTSTPTRFSDDCSTAATWRAVASPPATSMLVLKPFG